MPDPFSFPITLPFMAAKDAGKGTAGGGRASFKCDQCDWTSGDLDEADQHEEETGHGVFGAAAPDKGAVGRGGGGKVNWETATPEQRQKMNEFLAQNHRDAAAMGLTGRGTGK